MNDNANSPANPCKRHEYQIQAEGLTKREHFIAMAMQGLCASYPCNRPYHIIDISHDAVTIADKTIKLMEGE